MLTAVAIIVAGIVLIAVVVFVVLQICVVDEYADRVEEDEL